MILTALVFGQLVSSCARGNSAHTLESVAYVESGFETWTLHDNTTAQTYHPASLAEAISAATRLITTDGHSVDLGLMQINSANLPRLGLSIAEAFDPCRSIQGGARILRESYDTALRVAFSRYNTGDPVRGFSNGYVRRVELASQGLPDLSTSAVKIAPSSPLLPISSTAPSIVTDLLHPEKIGSASGEVVNLLPIMAEQESPSATARPRTSTASESQAVD